MIALTDAFATLGIALAIYAGCVNLFYGRRNIRFEPHYLHAVLTLLVLFILLAPARSSISLAAFVRGFSSDLSITFLALSVWSLCHRFGYVKPMDEREFDVLMATIAAAALLLYPTALGWGDWDAYRAGWGSWWFLSALLVLCAVSMLLGLRVLPSLVAFALLAWSAGVMESGNLWDYLLDPWLSVFALGFIFIKYLCRAYKFFIHRSSY